MNEMTHNKFPIISVQTNQRVSVVKPVANNSLTNMDFCGLSDLDFWG